MGYNFFHFSNELAGLPFEIEIKPIEDFYRGIALIKFPSIVVHPHLRKRLLINFPLNKGLKEIV